MAKDASWRFKMRGPKHYGLNQARPSNSLYQRRLSYLLYRLTRNTHERTSRETSKFQDFIKRMEIPSVVTTLMSWTPIKVVELLACFTSEANNQEVSKAQALVMLLSFLKGFTLSQKDAMVGMMSSAEGEIAYWPEVVQYLPTIHAHGRNIQMAVQVLWDTKQKPEENEEQFYRQMNDAFSRCGSELFSKK